MLLYRNRKEIHPLIKYMQKWQAFNAAARRMWNYFLLKALGATLLIILGLALLQYLF